MRNVYLEAHPRDLFDVRDLLANEGIGDDLRRAFLIYLASHNRPMAEVLNPTRKPLVSEFERSFAGMTKEPVELAELEAAREAIIVAMVDNMPDEHRRFLLGFKQGEPNCDLIGIADAQNLPAVRWKQRNLGKLPADKRRELAAALERVLYPARSGK